MILAATFTRNLQEEDLMEKCVQRDDFSPPKMLSLVWNLESLHLSYKSIHSILTSVLTELLYFEFKHESLCNQCKN